MNRALKSLAIFFAFVAIYALSRHMIGSTTTTTTTTTVAPTTTSTSAPLGSTCQGSDFRGVFNEGQGAAGTVTASVTLTKTTGGTCTLKGWGRLTLQDRTGAVIASSQTNTAANPPITYPVPQANAAPTWLTLKTGSTATFYLAYSDVPVGTETCPAAVTISVAIRSGGSTVAVTPQYPPQPCDGGHLYVSPFF